jgi:hypothetical protein
LWIGLRTEMGHPAKPRRCRHRNLHLTGAFPEPVLARCPVLRRLTFLHSSHLPWPLHNSGHGILSEPLVSFDDVVISHSAAFVYQILQQTANTPERHTIALHRPTQLVIGPQVGIAGHDRIRMAINHHSQYRVVAGVATARRHGHRSNHLATKARLLDQSSGLIWASPLPQPGTLYRASHRRSAWRGRGATARSWW